MYLWWSLCTLYLSGLCCCTCVPYFGRELTPLFVKLILHERSGPRSVSDLVMRRVLTVYNICEEKR